MTSSAGRPKTNSRIQWLEVDPGTAGTLWLGVDNPGKPALWRSRDRGATWNVVTDSYAGQMSTLHPVGYRIAFAPSRPSDIWVPSTNLHSRSRDGGKSWSDFRVENQEVVRNARVRAPRLMRHLKGRAKGLIRRPVRLGPAALHPFADHQDRHQGTDLEKIEHPKAQRGDGIENGWTPACTRRVVSGLTVEHSR